MVTIKQVQQQLNKLGYGPLKDDGIRGAKTTAAVKKFQKDNGLKDDGIVGSNTMAKMFKTVPVQLSKKLRILTTAQKVSIYGQPGDPRYQTVITLPYPMRLAWDLKTVVRSVIVHTKVATPFSNVFKEILAYYGYDQIRGLGLDLFGGTFNHRPMRGTETRYNNAIRAKNYALALTYLSSHSWAIAIDLDTARNQLRWGRDKAVFAQPIYKPMIDIFYRNGFISYGVEKNYDWMHFEIGVL